MTDEMGNTTAAAMWQDRHGGRRGHKLMTRELGDTIPALNANENAEDYDAVIVPAKLFCPFSGWRWYITEWDRETGLCFGLVEGLKLSWGTSISLSCRSSPCSAASLPWSGTSTGSPGPSARSGGSRGSTRNKRRIDKEMMEPCLTKW